MTPITEPSPPDTRTAPESPRVARFLRANRTALSLLLIPIIFALVGVAVSHLIREVQYADVVTALADTSWSTVALAVGFTALSFLALTFNDYDALAYIGHPLPWPQAALTAFSAYAVGNIAGFGPLSGGAIRYRAYSRLGLGPEEIGRVIAFVALAFGLGLAAITSLALLVVAEDAAGATGLHPAMLRLIAGAMLGAILLLFWLGRGGRRLPIAGRQLGLPPAPLALRQFLVTVIDVTAAASVLYVLLPAGSVGWPALLCIYAVALGLGVISHVPGGLGVFETVIVAGLGPSVDLESVLGALILYRLVYFVLPLVAATLVVGVGELRATADSPAIAGLRRVGGRLAPTLIAALCFVTGVLLVFSSVAPAQPERLDILAEWLPLPIVEAAHFLSSLLGLGLIVSARGLAHRLDGAWWLTLFAAAGALIFSPLRAQLPTQTVLVIVLLIALLPSRRMFYRPATLFPEAMTPAWLASIAVVVIGALVILFFAYRDVEYSHELWWQFEFSADAPRGLRALLGITLVSSVLAVMSLLRPAAAAPLPPADPHTIARAVEIVAGQSAAGANLVRMGDKRLLFSEDGRGFLMYGRQGRSWIGLFDPVGPPEIWAELIWRFIETARGAGGRAVLYQVSPALLAACADAGMRAYKLGEMAVVDLTRFDLKGGTWSSLRNSLSRGHRDGIEFAILQPPELPAVYDELARVSEGWLGHHNAREKGFSLGAFERDYVLSQPMAVLRLDGRIVAFANLLLTDRHEQCSIDLMRFAPEAPSGSMVYLFGKMMIEMRDQGFTSFQLGMAPLAGMSDSQHAPIWDVIAATVFENGEKFYNFKGLRAFKEKFRPDWQPRYLAVSGTANPIFALMDTTLLIGGGLKGVIGA